MSDRTYPDRPIEGEVENMGWGIAQQDGSTGYDLLPNISPTFEWIRLAQRVPDLIVTDLMMPRVDGISLCRSIRENPKTQSIKVLAITAFPEQDNVKKMYDAGADLCLIKPLQFEHFRLEVIRLLNEAVGSPAATSKSQG